MRALYWLRNDLRQQDNLCIDWLDQNCQTTDFVYCLPRKLVPESRPQDLFLEQCLKELQTKLKLRGQNLEVIVGPAPVILADKVSSTKADVLVFTQELNSRDQDIELQVRQACPPTLHLQTFDQRTLVPTVLVPGGVALMSDKFTPFYKSLSTLLLDLEELLPAHKPVHTARPAAEEFEGGEEPAWAHLNSYVDEKQFVRSYKDTRNGMLNWSDSSKLSPWLAKGCLSARQVFCAVRRHEKQFAVCESTTALIYELIWRDYFKFQALKHGSRIFELQGPAQRSRPGIISDRKLFETWTQGQTNSRFVNANMNELRQTGWMSNRGRQNVASYLAKHLNVDWRWGAQWFAEHLLDDDVESNWGNWNYVAGVGFDPKDRIFDVEWQAERYDPTGGYRQRWG